MWREFRDYFFRTKNIDKTVLWLNDDGLLNSWIIINGKEINAALIVTRVVSVIVLICFKLYAKSADTTYPKAAINIKNFGKKFPDWSREILINASKPKINITPSKPTNIEINVLRKNLFDFRKKCERNKVRIGATDSKSPAVLDWIYCSDQLIKKKGMKLPIKPIRKINNKTLVDKFTFNLLNLK